MPAHVAPQGRAGQERIQRSYRVPTPEAAAHRDVPPPPVVITEREDDGPEIQRAPGDPAPAPALAAPTITLTPGATTGRGNTLTAGVSFTPSAGETLTVTDWRYTTPRGDTVTRPKRDAKYQSEWKGVMALSGSLELSYSVKPRGKPAVAGTPVVTPVTVTDRAGASWQTTVTDGGEAPLTGVPSPPELARHLGLHVVPGDLEPAATDDRIGSGPNAGFVFVTLVQDRNYKSEPKIHPDVANAASSFRVFHRDAGRLYFVTRAGVRTLVPAAEYRVVSVAGANMRFSVTDWAALYKTYGIYTVTCSAGAKTVVARNAWWTLKPNAENGAVDITNPGAVRSALGIGTKTTFNVTIAVNGGWNPIALMPSANILAGTRSHEYMHARHSHRANFRAIVRALDPRRVLESAVKTPSDPVEFRDRIHALSLEISKPDHELVDEAASKAALRFVPVRGASMAAVNQDPASGASLGQLWDLTHDRPLG